MRNNPITFPQPRLMTTVKPQGNLSKIADQHDYFTPSVNTSQRKNNDQHILSEDNGINVKRHAEDYADYNAAEHESRSQPQRLHQQKLMLKSKID